MNPNEVKLNVQRMLANMEAELYGYKITKCDTMWNLFDLKTKAKWLLYNVLMPHKGEIVRLNVDLTNTRIRLNAEDDDYTLEKYPPYAEVNPKGIISVQAVIKPKTPIKFIKFEGLLSQLEKKDE